MNRKRKADSGLEAGPVEKAQQLFRRPLEKYHSETFLNDDDRLVDANGTKIFCTDGSCAFNGDDNAEGLADHIFVLTNKFWIGGAAFYSGQHCQSAWSLCGCGPITNQSAELSGILCALQRAHRKLE